jgi:hypothetical protein
MLDLKGELRPAGGEITGKSLSGDDASGNEDGRLKIEDGMKCAKRLGVRWPSTAFFNRTIPVGSTAKSAKNTKSTKPETNPLRSPRRAKALFQRDGGCVLPPAFYYGATSCS